MTAPGGKRLVNSKSGLKILCQHDKDASPWELAEPSWTHDTEVRVNFWEINLQLSTPFSKMKSRLKNVILVLSSSPLSTEDIIVVDVATYSAPNAALQRFFYTEWLLSIPCDTVKHAWAWAKRRKNFSLNISKCWLAGHPSMWRPVLQHPRPLPLNHPLSQKN